MLPPGTVSPEEQQLLISFLNNGGSLYLEGTNIGQDHSGTDFWTYFNVQFLSQGQIHNEINELIGLEDNFTPGTSFGYAANTYADIYVNRLAATDNNAVFQSQDLYDRVVFNADGQYRTMASSLIFGAMADGIGVSNKTNLVELYLSFLLDEQGPEVWFSNDSIDFGTVNPGDTQIEEILIQNTAQNLLEISSIEVIGEGFGYEGDYSFNLEFGHYTTLEIIFPAFEQGTYSGELIITSNDPDSPQVSIMLTGNCFADPSLYVSPDLFEIEIAPGETGNVTMNIYNNGGGYLDYSIEVRSVDQRDGGGPDSYGYTWIDSNEENGPAYAWQDISETGIDTGLSGIDAYHQLDIPFPFRFYGDIKQQVKISSNGYLTFGDDGIDYSNDPIPYPSNPNDLIAVFWDDLNSGENGKLYYLYDQESDRLIIQYTDWEIFSSGELLDFQVILDSSGKIQFIYNTMNGYLRSATSGIENFDATDGLEIVYNNIYIEDQLAVDIKTSPEWLELDHYYGSVMSGQPDQINLEIDAGSLEPGLYLAELGIISSDPGNSELIVPVTLEVVETENGDNVISILPELDQNYPNPFNPSSAGTSRNPGTTISYSLKLPGTVILKVYDIRGRSVRVLVNDFMEAGSYSVQWDGKDYRGNKLPSGVYLYQLKNENHYITRKLTLMR